MWCDGWVATLTSPELAVLGKSAIEITPGTPSLPLLADGSTLYPSEILQPTPRYDTGAFFASAQDPIRKDVLPYTMIAGDPASHYRLNTVGLRRNGTQGQDEAQDQCTNFDHTLSFRSFRVI